MEKTVSYSWNGTAEIAAANYPNMRLFQRQTVHPPGPNGKTNSVCVIFPDSVCVIFPDCINA